MQQRQWVRAVLVFAFLVAVSMLAPRLHAQTPQTAPVTTLNGHAHAAQAQETVVVTATVAPAPLGNLGRSVDVLTREDMLALPIATANDALRLLSSVEVRARGPFGVQADFSIRGAGFGQALVLVDGVRLNDAQSGHHNADFPVTLDAIERIEVLRGAGSSLHGADAFGGTINIITRRAVPRAYVDVAAGSFDLVEGSAGIGVKQGSLAHAFQGSVSRSSGFMTARDHRIATVQYQASGTPAGTFLLAHTDKEFGANGFYGPAPSREWTRQTLARYERRLAPRDRWQAQVQTAYRAHGDHFIYDETRPLLSESRHHTNAVSGQAKLHYTLSPATQVSVGAEAGGDWIGSSNLGDHAFGRGGVFAEVQQRIGDRLILHPGLRFDAYSRFGSAWSPSIAASLWSSSRVKWRASAGHAFRVPTFTELYYHDVNHQALGELDPERAWAVDGGVDLLIAPGWSAGLTTFGRWERNVIDWVRPSTAERWHTTNIRHVDSHGVEAGVRRQFGAYGEAGIQYTWQHLDAEALNLLSKYALDYAPRSLAASGVARLGAWTVGPRVEFKRRVDGRDYWVVDGRVGYRVARWEVYVDGLNLLDTAYQEIRGVDMPGRAVRFGVRLR